MGEVFAWGDNDEGQLGDGTLKAVARPRAIPSLQVNFYEFFRIIFDFVFSLSNKKVI